MSSRRSSVEFNGFELLTCILFLFPQYNKDIIMVEIKKEDIYEKIRFNKFEDREKYITDLEKKTSLMDNYIFHFQEETDKNEELKHMIENIELIYISGKKNKHEEIELLNKDLNNKETKADIYLKLINGEFIGISVKQSKKATKTNYSVQKMLGIDYDKELTQIKKTFLKENGIDSFKKTERKQINVLFYEANIYTIELQKAIQIENEKLKKQLTELLFSMNVPYNMYEFDGVKITKLNKVNDFSQVVFEDYLPYYYNSNGEKRKTAKLFYRLRIYNKIYRVEIRWKGNIYNSSPQFQIHEE
jgi:hypothetical protein